LISAWSHSVPDIVVIMVIAFALGASAVALYRANVVSRRMSK